MGELFGEEGGVGGFACGRRGLVGEDGGGGGDGKEREYRRRGFR